MNTAENTNSWHLNEPPAQGDTTPVLARVPWLAAAEQPAQAAMKVESLTAEPSYLESHSVMVAANLEMPGWDAPGTIFRIDSPQSHFRPMASACPPSSSTKTRPPQATVSHSVSREESTATSPGPVVQQPTARLRFDPPQQAASDHAAAVDVAQLPPPSNWHVWLAAIDNSIRQYHRVIVLTALLTAAGLMMLVLESQQPASEPAPGGISPAASHLAAPAEAFAAAEALPAPLEMAAEQIEQVTQARGPQSDTRRRTVAVEQEAAIPLEPLASPDELSPVEDITPIDEDLSDWSVSTNEAEPLPQVVAYPTTNAPEYVWPQTSSESAAPSDTPSVARLSRELQPVGGPTTK